MRAAEQTAKTNRLRLWADHKVTERAAIDEREFVAVVRASCLPTSVCTFVCICWLLCLSRSAGCVCMLLSLP